MLDEGVEDEWSKESHSLDEPEQSSIDIPLLRQLTNVPPFLLRKDLGWIAIRIIGDVTQNADASTRYALWAIVLVLRTSKCSLSDSCS
jgi:hypothetical protein